MIATSINRIALSCGLVLSTLIVLCPPVASGVIYKSETDIASKADWVMVLTSSKLKHFLEYTGSQLFPITQIRCSYLKSVGSDIVGPTKYEDLWYHDGSPVGCHHYERTLTRNRCESGVIYVEPGPESASDTRAVANAVIRLTVELSLQDILIIGVVVPQDMCQQMVSDLGTFGFHRTPSPTGAAAIHLVSNPMEFDEYLYFDSPSP